jgi:hypothetical protein
MAHMNAADGRRPAWWARLRQFFSRSPQNMPWLDLTQGELDDVRSKKTLRSVLERRRRNDLIRQREFDELRQVRHRGLERAPLPAHVSIFHDPESPVGERRELTLRKIDDIEVQMSRQWWGQMSPAPAGRAPGDEAQVDEQEFAPTQFGGEVSPAAVAWADARGGDLVPPLRWSGSSPGAAAPALDPALAEAALRWAAGDAGQAEQALLVALRGGASGARVPRLAALLDLYRATEQRVAFERALVEFAGDLTEPPPWALESDTPPGEFELEPVLAGDLAALLHRLTPACEDARCLQLSCLRLQRMDFAAAGALMNWLQGGRCVLELRDLSPLVAAFLETLGVAVHARLLPRRA